MRIVLEGIIDNFSLDQRWIDEKKRFDELGGAKGLLEGKFSWTLEGWMALPKPTGCLPR